MNSHNHLTSADPTAPPPQPPPPQPPRSSFSCDRHPQEQFTGFCPSCLCERLTTLDHSSNGNTPSSSRRPSSASNAIKALFASKPPAIHIPKQPSNPKPSSSNLPELRRSKSFSASKIEALFGGVDGGGGGFGFEPQRKSCDVRVRSTLWSLFEQEEIKRSNLCAIPAICDEASSSHDNRPKIVKPIEHSKAIVEETENVRCDDVVLACNDYEITPLRETNLAAELEVNNSSSSSEIVEEEVTTTMNHHHHHHTEEDDNAVEIRGKKGSGFWSAASVFSKKWQKWRQKQKSNKKKTTTDASSFTATLPAEKPAISRRHRETQSEIADYGLGRRSCDTDPRFSLDAAAAARISFEDPRYSFDEPRASWDGHFTGRSFLRPPPPMVSVLEDDVGPQRHVAFPRSDMQIPVEDANGTEVIDVPGGSIQTKEYYADCSSRRRKSLDRSGSIRRTAASVVAEIDELKIVANGGGDFRDLGSRSLRGESPETFRETSTTASSAIMGGAGERKEPKKSKKLWGWKLWGFVNRRGREENGEDFGDGNNNKNGAFNGKVVRRSNSSVSWRNSNDQIGNSFNSGRKSSVEIGGYSRSKRRDEFGLERNRSARYSSPNGLDNNGLLRFYLTPAGGGGGGGRRSAAATGKVKGGGNNSNNNYNYNNPQSIARSVLRLY